MLRDFSHNHRMDRRQAMQLGTGALVVAALGAIAGDVVAEVVDEELVCRGGMMFELWPDDGEQVQMGVGLVEVYRRVDGAGRLTWKESRDAPPISVPLPSDSMSVLLKAVESAAALEAEVVSHAA